MCCTSTWLSTPKWHSDEDTALVRIAELVGPERVGIDVRAISKKQVLLEVAKMLAVPSGLHDTTIFRALAGREDLGTTGFGQGIAVPHARLRELESTYAVVARLAKPVDFEAGDDRPVDLVCAIIGPGGPDDRAVRSVG